MSQNNDPIAVAERFMAALNIADEAGVRACYSPDPRIWHNFDDKLQPLDQNIKSMHWMHRQLKNLNYDVQSRVALPNGFLQEHILRGTLSNGEDFALHACAICTVENGRITELREYLDTAETQPLLKQA